MTRLKRRTSAREAVRFAIVLIFLSFLGTSAVRAHVHVQGNATAVEVDIDRARIAEVLSALGQTFNVRYRTSIALDELIGGTYSGSLGGAPASNARRGSSTHELSGAEFQDRQEGIRDPSQVFNFIAGKSRLCADQFYGLGGVVKGHDVNDGVRIAAKFAHPNESSIVHVCIRKALARAGASLWGNGTASRAVQAAKGLWGLFWML